MFIRNIAVLIAAAVVILSAGEAAAVPAFSKKYQAPCTMCHDSWPRLNGVGMEFKLNGFQAPGSQDGGKAAKYSPTENLFLDIGSSNPPIAFRLEGGIILKQSSSGPEGPLEDKFFCCVEGNAATLSVGGSVARNMAAWLVLPWGKESVEQGYLRYVNMFGPGMFSVDLGSMKVVDYDAVPAGREWFGAPLVALHGHPYIREAAEAGLTAPHNDTGVRVYGRPSYGNLTYEAGMYTGSQVTGFGEDDAGMAYTFMGRMDLNKLAVSLRYWGNKSGMTTQTVTGPSGEVAFPADPSDADENTQEFILSARYTHPYFALDLTLDKSSFSIGDRATADGAHTFSQDTINRLAYSVGAIWLVNSWFETGLAYGWSAYDSYTRTVDGQVYELGGIGVSMLQLRFAARPVMNMRLALELQVDMSEAEARKLSDGTDFNAQNKILVQWDMSL